MRRHPIDQRAARYIARQAVSDHGTHKDAPRRKPLEPGEILQFRPTTGRIIYSAKPNESNHGR